MRKSVWILAENGEFLGENRTPEVAGSNPAASTFCFTGSERRCL